MIRRALSLAVLVLLPGLAAAETGPNQLALLPSSAGKNYDRGNCFQWTDCRGESIGNLWVHAPDFCRPLGGKSWRGQDGQCRNLSGEAYKPAD